MNLTQADLHAASTAAWLVDQKPGIKIGGRELSFVSHPYLVDFLDDHHPDQCIIKGAQLGWTVAAMIRAIAEIKRRNLRGVLYLFPRQDDIADFSRARLNPLIQENPVFRAMVEDTDAMSLKRIGGGNLYLRHIGGDESVVKSIDCDRVIYDERDEMDDDKVELADHRLDSSKEGIRIEFSTPTLPNFGVSKAYEESDQHTWQIRCRAPGCTAWTCLETSWPDCLRRMPDGRVIRACQKCGGEIFVNDGDWVAKYPTRKHKRGRWVSQLCGDSPRQQPDFILSSYERATRDGKLREFHNSVLGMPYAEIDDVLSEALLLTTCDQNEPRKLRSVGPTAMGFDVGGSDFHWIVGEKRSDKLLQIVAFGKAESEDEMADIWKNYAVQRGVVDGMAEQRAVRDLKARLPGLWDCIYSSRKVDDSWEPREKRVTVNRSLICDESHQGILKGTTRLPRADEKVRKELIPQLCNLARQVLMKGRDVKTPEIVWSCVGTKNDHYRHALNYLTLAAESLPTVQKRDPTDYKPRIGKSLTSWMAR